MSNDWARIESWAKIFKNPSQLLQTVVANVFSNREGVMADIAELKADTTGDSINAKDLGLTVADLLTKAIGEVPASTGAVQNVGLTKDEVLLFMNGLFTGLVQDDNLAAVTACIKDTETIEPEIVQVFELLRAGGTANYIHAGKMVKLIFDQAKGDEEACIGMEEDWKRITEWVLIFENPTLLIKTVVENLFDNRTKIEADIKELKADNADGNAKDLGLMVADLIVLSIGAVASPAPSVVLY